MFNKNKIVLELDNIYYNITDLVNALIEYYKNSGIKCEVIGKDNLGNPILLMNSRKYFLKVRNVGPNFVQYTLPPGDVWPTFMSVQQIILTEI